MHKTCCFFKQIGTHSSRAKEEPEMQFRTFSLKVFFSLSKKIGKQRGGYPQLQKRDTLTAWSHGTLELGLVQTVSEIHLIREWLQQRKQVNHPFSMNWQAFTNGVEPELVEKLFLTREDASFRISATPKKGQGKKKKYGQITRGQSVLPQDSIG